MAEFSQLAENVPCDVSPPEFAVQDLAKLGQLNVVAQTGGNTDCDWDQLGKVWPSDWDNAWADRDGDVGRQ
jgi:hypothetical protein